jgi:hypothetical protein
MLVPMLQEDVTTKILLNKKEAKYYQYRKAKPMPELNVGEQVYEKLKGQNDKWTKGQVQKQVKSWSCDVTVNEHSVFSWLDISADRIAETKGPN